MTSTHEPIGPARRITIAPGDDVEEFLFDQGVTDGLPVVPPTPDRVERMLAATRRDSAGGDRGAAARTSRR